VLSDPSPRRRLFRRFERAIAGARRPLFPFARDAIRVPAPSRVTDDSYRPEPTAHDDPPPPLTSSSRHSHSSSDSASEPGTIRGDFCIELGRNVIHGSDAVESAQHEIGLWFPEGVTNYEHTAKAWIYE
jgi:hypothetical protein